jgi:S-adenosylmethionine decarboxylase
LVFHSKVSPDGASTRYQPAPDRRSCGCHGLGDLALVEAALREAAEAAHATVLDVQLHHFGPGMGVTGVALLAESHISIHTAGTRRRGRGPFCLRQAGRCEAGLECIRARLGGGG